MATLSEATLKLWIYDGQITTYDQANPQYTITKTKLSSEQTILFEIGELVKDYIDIYFDGDYTTANLTSWVSYEIESVFDKDLSTEKKAIKIGHLLGTHGYGYFEDEINPQLINPLQQSNTCIFWKKGEKVRIPLYSGQSLYDVEWYEDGVQVSSDVFGQNLEPITADTTDFKASHEGLISADMTHIGNTNESQYSVDSLSPLNANKVIVKTKDGTEVTVFVTYVEECKNTPFKITFINKFGVLQDIWMFGRRKESAEASRDSFKVNTIESTTAQTFYPTYKPTDKIHNVNAYKSLTLNTGFVCEDYNEVIQQLLFSEKVWIHEDNKVFPVTPKDNTIEYKTNLYEKVLNYTISFDYAYSEINLVR